MILVLKARARTGGSTLLVGLFVMGLIGVALASYLRLTTNQNQLSQRSQVWNSSLVMAESGIEEALTHISWNSTNLAAQGWALASGRYTKTTWLGSGYYVASISTNSPYDAISTGYYPMPGTSSYVSRQVKVTTTAAPAFLGAIVCKGTLSLNGNPAEIDSYDSRTNSKSTNGKYDAAKRGDKADVILASSGTSFGIGNGNIWGHAYTSPSITVSKGPHGTIGDVAWQTSFSGFQPGWVVNTANITVPDATTPFTVAVPPASGSVGGVAYDYVLSSGDYAMATLDKKCIVTGTRVRLYVSGDINSSTLVIETNASVEIYCAGTSASFSTVNNKGTAPSLKYFGLPANTSINLSGSWVGGVYAPNADFNIAGNKDVSGALVVHDVSISGNSGFHFDEALLGSSTASDVIIASWNEL